MNLEVDAEIIGLDGNPIPFDSETAAPTRLKDVCRLALLDETRKDAEHPNGEERFKRWQLAGRINAGGSVTVSAEEMALLKTRIGERFAAAIVGPAWTLLESMKS